MLFFISLSIVSLLSSILFRSLVSIFLNIILIPYQAHYLFLFCLGLLLWFYLVLSLCTYFSFSSCCLLLCVCFCVSEKSATSAVLESMGFVMKSFCSALQCNVSIHQHLALHVSFLCVCCLHPAIASESLFLSVQRSALTLYLLWAVFSLCDISET